MGRDHGLPGYNEYREICGMPKACSWNSAPPEIPAHLWSKLSTLYDAPSDIDLFSAGIAENSLSGAHVGPTFACIIGRQFKALKDGDRFFFTHTEGSNPNPFTPDQLTNIKARSLGDILCDNTAIGNMPTDVFVSSSTLFKCDQH